MALRAQSTVPQRFETKDEQMQRGRYRGRLEPAKVAKTRWPESAMASPWGKPQM